MGQSCWWPYARRGQWPVERCFALVLVDEQRPELEGQSPRPNTTTTPRRVPNALSGSLIRGRGGYSRYLGACGWRSLKDAASSVRRFRRPDERWQLTQYLPKTCDCLLGFLSPVSRLFLQCLSLCTL